LEMKKKVSQIQNLMNQKRFDEAQSICFELIGDARITYNIIKIQHDNSGKD
jgi:hypothetical protein